MIVPDKLHVSPSLPRGFDLLQSIPQLSPSSGLPIHCNRRLGDFLNSPKDVGYIADRVAAMGILRWCNRLKSDKDKNYGADPIVIPKQDLYNQCIPEEMRIHCSLNQFGRNVTNLCSYQNITSIRKRSGGKDEVTKKNKLQLISACWKFNSVHDLMWGTILKCAFWIPWLIQKNGQTGDVGREQFMEFISAMADTETDFAGTFQGILVIEPFVADEKDVLADGYIQPDDQVDDEFVRPNGPPRSNKQLKEDKIPKSKMTREEWENAMSAFLLEFSPKVLLTREEKWRFSLRFEPGYDHLGYEV